jgi:hypothetical protein
MVNCVELFVDAIDTPTAVVTWEKNCQLITHADLKGSQRVAIRDMHPPQDLRKSCDDYVLSKSANDFAYRRVGSHGSQMVTFNSVLGRSCRCE